MALLGLGLVALGVVVVVYIIASPSYQQQLQDAISSTASVVGQSITTSIEEIKQSESVLEQASKACEKTATKIARERKTAHYWLAINVTLGGTEYYIPAKSLSYSQAIATVMSGGSVFADTKKNAYNVAKAAGYGAKPILHPAHGGGRKSGYYRHFHPVIHGRKGKGHVFYPW